MNDHAPHRSPLNRVLFFFLPVLMLGVFGISILLLNANIGDFEALSAERQAGLAASAVWEYLNLGEAPNPQTPQSPGQFGPPAGGLDMEKRQKWLMENFFTPGALSSGSPAFVTGPPQWDGADRDEARKYLSKINGMAILGRRGEILIQKGDESFSEIKLDTVLSGSRVLPFGDRAFQTGDGDLLYLRNAGLRLRQSFGMGPPQRWLVVSYDTGDIRADANLRRFVLFGLSAIGIILLGGTLFFYLRTRTLRAQYARQETLARLGLAARTLAHEIRNPLSVIVMQKAMLQKSLGEAYADELKRIERESERISSLTRKVKDMLDKPAGHPVRVDLLAAISALLDGNVAWQEKVVIDAKDDVAVFADTEHLRTILANLIDNALKQHERNGTKKQVTISWRAVKRKAEILVRDWGGGVPKEIASRIFDPFFTTRAEGSGVGLSLSKSLALAAGGDLDFRNHGIDGLEGAEFRLSLPMADKAE